MNFRPTGMVWLCALAICACSAPNPSGPSTDTESHWLRSCASNASCPDGAECVCGVCTAQCQGTGACKEVSGPATCVSSADVPETCPQLPDETGACLESCESDAECRKRDRALACVDGSCTRTTYEPLSCGSDAPGGERIDLGDEGLSRGDAIDPYLEKYLEDGVEVHVPAGTYRWNGGGLEASLEYASLVGEDEVVLEMPEDYEFRAEFATETRFELRGITFRGRAGSKGGIAAYATSSGGTMVFRDVRIPDGSVSAQQTGIYVDPDHAGDVYFIDLEIRGFASAGIKAYPAAVSNDGKGGSVYVVGGRYQNNNVANLWLGPSESVVRRVLSIQDDSVPSEPGNTNTNQRGIWVDQGSAEVTIEESDFIQRASAAAAIVSSAPASGTIRDVRVANDLQQPAIALLEGDWSGNNVDVTGTGRAEIVGGSDISDVCKGTGCAEPRSSPQFVCSE